MCHKYNKLACVLFVSLGNNLCFLCIIATSIWEIGREKSTNTYVDFGDKVGQSDLAVFGFNEDIIMDLWGICDDGKKGRFNVGKKTEQLPPGVKEFNDNY